MVVRPEQRTTQEDRALEPLGALHPEIQTALALFASLAALIRERSDPQPTRQSDPQPTRQLE